MNAKYLLAVACGGAIGAAMRYLVSVASTRLLGISFPWGVLIINVTGSGLLGAFVALSAARWNLSPAWQLFLTAGICGGYTTFSTFSLDAYVLLQRGEVGPATAYIVASVVLSIAALVAGMHLVRPFP